MQGRMRFTVGLAAIIYTAWACFGMWWRFEPAAIEVAANVLVGAVLGVLFNFTGVTGTGQFSLINLVVAIVFSALLFGIFALFSVRLLDAGYIAEQAWHGVAFGAVMWILGYISIGIASDLYRERAIAVGVCVAGLFIAPIMATLLFNGALFAIVAVGTRILAGVTLMRLPLEQQGFIFGTALGICVVALPGIGLFAYGTY